MLKPKVITFIKPIAYISAIGKILYAAPLLII
jgi:hypothetical protein